MSPLRRSLKTMSETGAHSRTERAWAASGRVPLRRDHNRCAGEVANHRAAVDLVRQELEESDPHPLAVTDIVLLLHNLIATLLAHQDCDPGYLAESIDRADEAFDRQARILIAAIDMGAERRVLDDERLVLAGVAQLRTQARTAAGLEG